MEKRTVEDPDPVRSHRCTRKRSAIQRSIVERFKAADFLVQAEVKILAIDPGYCTGVAQFSAHAPTGKARVQTKTLRALKQGKWHERFAPVLEQLRWITLKPWDVVVVEDFSIGRYINQHGMAAAKSYGAIIGSIEHALDLRPGLLFVFASQTWKPEATLIRARVGRNEHERDAERLGRLVMKHVMSSVFLPAARRGLTYTLEYLGTKENQK